MLERRELLAELGRALDVEIARYDQAGHEGGEVVGSVHARPRSDSGPTLADLTLIA